MFLFMVQEEIRFKYCKRYPGGNQAHENCYNIYHPGNRVEKGIYCNQSNNIAESYSGVSVIKGEKYKI